MKNRFGFRLVDLDSNPGNKASCYLFTHKLARALGSSKRLGTQMFDNRLTTVDSIHQRRDLGLSFYVSEFLCLSLFPGRCYI